MPEIKLRHKRYCNLLEWSAQFIRYMVTFNPDNLSLNYGGLIHWHSTITTDLVRGDDTRLITP